MEAPGQLAAHRFELSKSLLYLSALGLFAKLLKADVSGVLLPGVALSAEHTAWAAGFIGMVLLFTLLAYVVCVLEVAYFGLVSGDTKRHSDLLLKSPKAVVALSVVAALGSSVYLLPPVLAAYASWQLRKDTINTFVALWRIL